MACPRLSSLHPLQLLLSLLLVCLRPRETLSQLGELPVSLLQFPPSLFQFLQLCCKEELPSNSARYNQ